MTTRRENLLALFAGDAPKWVPCAVNFNQWHRHHRRFDTLPEELRGLDYIDSLKHLGCDLLNRNGDGGWRMTFPGLEIDQLTSDGPTGPRHRTVYHTPYGDLSTVSQVQTEQSASYVEEDAVKDWSRDRKAFFHVLEHLRFEWDAKKYTELDRRIGDDGLPFVSGSGSPLKFLHLWFGLDHACLFLTDHPDDAKAICDIYWSKYMDELTAYAEHPETVAFCVGDNVDTPFYPPAIARQYWTGYLRQASDLFNRYGKKLFVHACGKLHQLLDEVRASGIHGLEGMTHPPLGDITPHDIRSMPDHFIFNGGFSAHEQVIKTDEEVRAFYDGFFGELRGHHRMVFASACQTTITTPWSRIKLVVNLCRRHGGQPD